MAEPVTGARRDATLSAFATRRLGRYELLTQIGKGGMAEVHLAMQRGPGGFEKLVVIKLVHEHLASKQAFVDMLLDEGRLAGMIKHPNVIDIYDLGEADGRYYVAMEYLDGEPLLGILRRGVEGQRLDPLSTARVIADTAEGLEAAHRLKTLDGKPLGLIHHDVSLGNIVVLYNGQVKLVDFGVAKARSQGKQELVQGKFSYMAPEKLKEGAEVDRRSDIWSLGVVAWEALTLQRLFKAKTDAETMQLVADLEIPPPSKANPDVPVELDAVILRALERDPEKRASTAKGLALDIESVLRKKGYAGKNDRIAGYMETAFGDQIKVREKLVAELSAGRTSKATIDAFRDAHGVPITPVPGGVPAAVAPELSDGLPGTTSRSDASAVARRESLKDLQTWVEDERKWRTQPWWKRYAPFLAGGFVLLVLIIAIAGRSSSTSDATMLVGDRTSRDGDRPSGDNPIGDKPISDKPVGDKPVGDKPVGDSAPNNSTATDKPATGDNSTTGDKPVTGDKPTGDKPIGDERITGDEPTGDKPITDKPTGDKPITNKPTTGDKPITNKPTTGNKPTNKPVTSKPNPTRPIVRPTSADALYRLGMNQLRRGDGNGALTSFTQATKANPSFAPGWYGLGRAYEATGTRRGPTKAAYQRYLSIAPTGSHAVDARARIDKL